MSAQLRRSLAGEIMLITQSRQSNKNAIIYSYTTCYRQEGGGLHFFSRCDEDEELAVRATADNKQTLQVRQTSESYFRLLIISALTSTFFFAFSGRYTLLIASFLGARSQFAVRLSSLPQFKTLTPGRAGVN